MNLTLPAAFKADLEAQRIQRQSDALRELDDMLKPVKEAAAKYYTQHEPTLAMIKNAMQLASEPDPVLIIGPTGTGKELVAKILGATRRRFEAINVAGLTATLFQSLLFGYVPGAYSGASREGSLGLLRSVGDGTMFLDEVGELPYELQHILLRVIETRKVLPVGANEEVPINCRFVFATNKSLPCDGFRDDLYYRIATFELRTTGLKDRGPAEVQYIAAMVAKSRGYVLGAEEIPESWYARGNVRQLIMMLRRKELGLI